MRRPPPHNWLFVFKVIVESGSITEASERLNVSQSAVSQQIKSLEDYLGRRLIIRSKKGVSLTDVGKHYYNVIKISLDRISLATDQLFGQGHRGTITVKSNYSFVDVWLSRNLSEFHDLYPNICVEIYTGLWLTDFGGLEHGIEIRYGDGDWNDANCYQLTDDSIFPVCSPALKSEVKNIENLLDYPLVSVMGNKVGWSEWFRHHQVDLKNTPSRLYVESNLLAYKSSMSGDYISLGIDSLVNGFVERGELVKLDFGSIKTRENFFILEPSENSVSEQETLFADWVKSKYVFSRV
uniref:LysR family transcriptional regulator n=1 Tax=Marinobacterium profundum TaxID=1714300 RepID=UPI0008374DE4|nr:LysR family transcriptional regulator [Marinobacterium profundum]